MRASFRDVLFLTLSKASMMLEFNVMIIMEYCLLYVQSLLLTPSTDEFTLLLCRIQSLGVQSQPLEE